MSNIPQRREQNQVTPWEYAPSVARLKSLRQQVREELRAAHEALTADSKRKKGRQWPEKTFATYCDEAGISTRTGYRWLAAYPDEGAVRILPSSVTSPLAGTYPDEDLRRSFNIALKKARAAVNGLLADKRPHGRPELVAAIGRALHPAECVRVRDFECARRGYRDGGESSERRYLMGLNRVISLTLTPLRKAVSVKREGDTWQRIEGRGVRGV